MNAIASPTSDLRPPTSERRGRPRIQDEFTDRKDLSPQQKFYLRHPNIRRQPGNPGSIRGWGSLTDRRERTDLGLALLSLVAIPGVPLSQDDIAAWCGCTRANIYNIEKTAMRKLRNALFFRDRETLEELRDHLARAQVSIARPTPTHPSLA